MTLDEFGVTEKEETVRYLPEPTIRARKEYRCFDCEEDVTSINDVFLEERLISFFYMCLGGTFKVKFYPHLAGDLTYWSADKELDPIPMTITGHGKDFVMDVGGAISTVTLKQVSVFRSRCNGYPKLSHFVKQRAFIDVACRELFNEWRLPYLVDGMHLHHVHTLAADASIIYEDMVANDIPFQFSNGRLPFALEDILLERQELYLDIGLLQLCTPKEHKQIHNEEKSLRIKPWMHVVELRKVHSEYGLEFT